MRTVRTFQQSTNVLVFRDPRTIGQQAANWHLRWVIRDNHAGLGSGPDPASRAGIGLALGGGFARGFAHLGVLQVLEQNHIPIACIAGTSVGSILGAAYASGAPLARIIATCRTLKFRDIGSWRVSRLGLASNHRLADLIARVFDSKQFEDLQIPMAVVATDLNTGEPVVLTHGNLVDAIRASCAFPGLFEPVKIGTRCLADGGLVAPVPTGAARQLGAEFVLGVSVGIHDGDRGTPSNIFQVVARAVSAAQKHQLEVWERHADLVIRPDVQSFAWDAFDRADEAIEAGAAITRRALPRIRKYLDRVLAAPVCADNRSASLAAPASGHAEPGGDDPGAGLQSALVVTEIAR
jgi:NTE family protein